MRLEPVRVEVHAATTGVAEATASGVVSVGPIEVSLDLRARDSLDRVGWTIANRGDGVERVRAVRLVLAAIDVDPPLRIFRNGYQSWSRTGMATLGVDTDPSTLEPSIELVRGVHHADQRVADPGELRSELVTVLRDRSGPALLVGFDAGHDHDGTIRVREVDGRIEVVLEAFLGDATIEAGEQRHLHGVRLEAGDDHAALLEAWAEQVGRDGGARVGAPYQVGWCSWYHYFHDVTEAHVRANLALADDWPFAVYQVDDGYQSAIGDWLTTNDKFPSELSSLADDITAAGYRPGIWLAPFIAAPDSQVARDHPDWLARHAESGLPLTCMWNEAWGGIMYGLDTSNPEVLDHVSSVAANLVAAGYPYLKLDFTFSPSFDGVWHDPAMTPAQRVRAGYDAVRQGAGEDAFLLGCGAPLGPVIGVVDGNRIGPDVAPSWEVDGVVLPGYADTQPSTKNAWRSTLARSFMHRRLWLNDPDCIMLRSSDTALGAGAARAWAHAVAVSGGMALVSDDLALLDDDARALLDDVIEIGRAVDADASRGMTPRCTDLMDALLPGRLAAAGYVLEADPEVPTAHLSSS